MARECRSVALAALQAQLQTRDRAASGTFRERRSQVPSSTKPWTTVSSPSAMATASSDVAGLAIRREEFPPRLAVPCGIADEHAKGYAHRVGFATNPQRRRNGGNRRRHEAGARKRRRDEPVLASRAQPQRHRARSGDAGQSQDPWNRQNSSVCLDCRSDKEPLPRLRTAERRREGGSDRVASSRPRGLKSSGATAARKALESMQDTRSGAAAPDARVALHAAPPGATACHRPPGPAPHFASSRLPRKSPGARQRSFAPSPPSPSRFRIPAVASPFYSMVRIG